jgi:pilus assembly protein TadC
LGLLARIKMAMHALFQRLAKFFPLLKMKLKQAGMNDKPEEFIKKTVISSAYMAFGVIVLIFMLLSKFDALRWPMLFGIPIIFLVLFSYLLKLPDLKISKKEKEISREIIFAGRFLIIELESGVPLYNAMINISKNFNVIGKHFKEITDKIDMGTSIEDALNEAAEMTPSDDFRKILRQIINSIRTGSNVAKSLYSVVNQITKNQVNEVNKYGKKLNPLAMFYMIIAVILPSLGVTMLIILSSFIQFQLSLEILLILAGLLSFVQFMFISMIKFSRPPIEF